MFSRKFPLSYFKMCFSHLKWLRFGPHQRRRPTPALIRHLSAGATDAPRTMHLTPTILRADHYGWFDRVARGVCQLTPLGEQALAS